MIEQLQKNHTKIIKYVILILASLLVLITGIREIRLVLNRDLHTYYVSGRTIEHITADAVYNKEFLCVGGEMDSIQIETIISENTKGSISYSIFDDKENIVVKSEDEIQNLCNEELQGIFIDVKNTGLEQGKFYKITVDYSQTENATIVINDGELSIRQFFEAQYKDVFVCVITVVVLLSIVWLIYTYKKGYGAKVFFVTSLVMGVLTILLSPPLSRDDEYRHFIRAYTGAVEDAYIEYAPLQGNESGVFTSPDRVEYVAVVPYEINELRLLDFEANYNGTGYHQEGNTRLCLEKVVATLNAEPNDEMYRVSATATATRSDIYYWPQIIAMKIGAFLGISEMLLFWLARFGQVFVCVCLETIAVKIAPKLKEMIWLLAFIPNALLLKASCNCDGLLISEIVLLVAVVVWLKEEKIDIFSVKGLIGIAAYGILTYNIMIMKIPYVIVSIGLLIYLGKENFNKLLEFVRGHKKPILVGSVMVVMIGIIGFIIMDKSILLNIIFRFLPAEHFYYILGNPGYIVRLFLSKWFEMIINLYVGMKGNAIITYPIAVVILIAMLKRSQPIWKRLWYAVLFAILIMIIVLVGYTMTPANYGVIWGITYRYILPFMLVGALCLPSGNERTDVIAKFLVPVCLVVVIIPTLLSWGVWWCI